ncbi:MAG TPA: GNAT family N-acetyltransferase [Patescibacteria group bacterium]|nr:GNAT family N-acetyltransferase [Patescibacteria group bacterium]
MKIEALKNERIADFVAYCKKHKIEIDDSFLYDEDLKEFVPDDENPTYIVADDAGKIIAAASLIIDDYNRKGKKGRFRIFHAEVENIDCYRMLMEAILKHTAGLNKVNIFVPIVNEKLMKIFEKLDFKAERYSYLLVREDLEVPAWNLPEDYEIKPFRVGCDEEVWCEVRNASFATLQGSETPLTPEMVAKMVSAEDYIEGGLMVLYHKEKPVGVVRGSKDDYEDAPIMNIGPLAIIPEYQGKGLGRIILRESLRFAKDEGYHRTILCVNAENDRAKSLYVQEGFKQVEAVVCYKYDLANEAR